MSIEEVSEYCMEVTVKREGVEEDEKHAERRENIIRFKEGSTREVR